MQHCFCKIVYQVTHASNCLNLMHSIHKFCKIANQVGPPGTKTFMIWNRPCYLMGTINYDAGTSRQTMNWKFKGTYFRPLYLQIFPGSKKNTHRWPLFILTILSGPHSKSQPRLILGRRGRGHQLKNCPFFENSGLENDLKAIGGPRASFLIFRANQSAFGSSFP